MIVLRDTTGLFVGINYPSLPPTGCFDTADDQHFESPQGGKHIRDRSKHPFGCLPVSHDPPPVPTEISPWRDVPRFETLSRTQTTVWLYDRGGCLSDIWTMFNPLSRTMNQNDWTSIEISPDHKSTPIAIDSSKGKASDGSKVKWMTVAGSVLIYYASSGVVNSFGFFQNFYTDNFLKDTPTASIAIIGTLQMSLMSILSVVSGALCDRYGIKVSMHSYSAHQVN